MTQALEFSSFYKILNAVKEGDNSQKDKLDSLLASYKKGDTAESFLHELAQIYLYIGVEELFNYTNSTNLKFIGDLSKDEWDELASNHNCDLPINLANSMIKSMKDDESLNQLSLKWGISIGEIKKHVMPLARYITEGLIDVLE